MSDEEKNYIMMVRTDYVQVLVPLKDVEKRKEQGWTLVEEKYPHTKQPVTSSKMIQRVEQKMRNLFKTLAENKLIHPSPYEKYDMNDFLEIFLHGDNNYTIEEYDKSVGILIELGNLGADAWTRFHYIFKLVFKGENVPQLFTEYMDLRDWKSDLQRLNGDNPEFNDIKNYPIFTGKQPDWRPGKMVYFDFKTKDLQTIRFWDISEYRNDVNIHENEIKMHKYSRGD